MSNSLETTAREALALAAQKIIPSVYEHSSKALEMLSALAQGYLDLLETLKSCRNVSQDLHFKCDDRAAEITQLKSENEKLDQKVLRLHGSLSKANSNNAKLVEALEHYQSSHYDSEGRPCLNDKTAEDVLAEVEP